MSEATVSSKVIATMRSNMTVVKMCSKVAVVNVIKGATDMDEAWTGLDTKTY
jgi:hypothetical protein